MPVAPTEMECFPLAVLIDELKHKDFQVRLNAIKQLSTIALALGQERTRSELVQFLEEALEDEDEVLQTLAEELGSFVPLVGGAEYAHCLLPLLETLATQEETIVREKAVKSIKQVCAVLVESGVTSFHADFHQVIVKLSNGDWFTSRVSACGLFASVYPYVSDQVGSEQRDLFAQLCKDETPMVKRAAASALGPFAKAVGIQHTKGSLIELFQLLAKDSQDSVRLLTVEAAVYIAEMFAQEDNGSFSLILDTLRSYFTDRSWRVRYAAADNFAKLQSAAKSLQDFNFVKSFITLLEDGEPEVRGAAASKLPEFTQQLSDADRVQVIQSQVIPAVNELVSDTNQNVRAALANVVMTLAPTLGREQTMEVLLPMFLQLLGDEFPDVRLNIISKLESVNEVIGMEVLSQSLLPAIVELAQDRQWRVRLAIIEYIPLLAKQLGVTFFDEKLSKLCMTWLEDCVFSIREAATKNLQQLAEAFGADWAMQRIEPMIAHMCEHHNYLFRMTSLFAISALVQVSEGASIANRLAKTVCSMAVDDVPNVRFNVAITLGRMYATLGKDEGTKQILPALQDLSNDQDFDVRYFAFQAIAANE